MSEQWHKATLFRFPEALSPGDEREFYRLLEAFPEEIPGIVDFSCGEDASGRAKGYTHGLIIRFTSQDAYEAYAPHPTHQRFADFVHARDCDVLSFNYPISRP